MYKRIISIIICCIMVGSVCLTGCNKKAEKDSNTKDTSTTEEKAKNTDNNKEIESKTDNSVTSPGEFPIVNNKISLNVLVQANAGVEDFSTNDFTKWYEEKTNVNIKFDLLPVKSGEEKLNLILASGDYPDAFMGCPFDMTQIMNYGSQGIFLPVNDLIEKHGYEIKKIFTDKATAYVKDVLTFPDGNMYSMPSLNECYHCSMAQKMWIYRPWLDKLNLKMPETTEEFYNVLKAFRDNDPNGNGKQDEIPLASATTGWYTKIDGYLMCPFIYSDSGKRVYLKNGKVTVPFDKSEWKEGLKYIRKLYAEELLSPETFTQDGDQLRQMGENPDEVILGAAPGGHNGVMAQFYGESGRWLDYEAVPALKGPDGTRTSFYYPFGIGVGSFVISSTCKYPEVAVRWVDGLYEMETTLRSVFGRKDVEWKIAEDGEIGLNGEQALYKHLKPWSETVQNYCWQQTGPNLRTARIRLGQVSKEDEPLEPILFEATKTKYEPYIPSLDSIMPPLAFSAEQSSEMADLKKTIFDYVDEMVARFITGDVDIEEYWDNYTQELENMNLKRYLEIYQEAYDDKYK